MNMKSTTFWDVKPCSLVEAHWPFRETYCLYIKGWRVSQAGSDHKYACWLCGLLIFPEERGSIYLQNVGELVLKYTASQHRK
jgi:hypothetical protein